MRKIISFMHVSLDGFVSGPHGELNWAKVDQELFEHIGERCKKGDSALYGRKTFQMMESYWPEAGKKPNATRHDIEHSAWYNGIRKIVLSTTLNAADFSNTTVVSDQIADHINALRHEDGGEILLFGSPTATHYLLNQNLIDGFWLFLNPTILGQGVSLFKDVTQRIGLKLLPEGRRFSNGVTELNYEIER